MLATFSNFLSRQWFFNKLFKNIVFIGGGKILCQKKENII